MYGVIAPRSLAEWRQFQRDVGQMERDFELATPIAVAVFAHELDAAMAREFAPHDRTGKSNDPSLWNRNYRHTLQRRSVVLLGNRAVITWGGGAAYVQEGTSPHVIRAKNTPFLHFKGSKGWVRKKEINHPGSKADPFLDRAVADTSGASAFAALFDRLNVRSITQRFAPE